MKVTVPVGDSLDPWDAASLVAGITGISALGETVRSRSFVIDVPESVSAEKMADIRQRITTLGLTIEMGSN